MNKPVLIALMACGTAAHAQSLATSQTRLLWQSVMTNVSAAALDVDEKLYAYKPTPEVRSFGALIAHVAGSQKMFCAMALGDKAAAEDDVEKTARTKAAIVAALQESNTYCEKAYKQTDAATAKMIDVFGEQRTKLYALMLNASHDDEHYGNIVTYMRLNKLVPPSSRPSPPAKP